MSNVGRRRFRWSVRAAVMGWMALCCGCGDKGDAYEIIPLEGKIESVTVLRGGTGEITVSYHSKKHGQEITGTGIITRETEITINGIVARLQDLREGERIRGEVRVEKKHGTKIQTVLKIDVDRAVPKSVADG